MTNSTFNPTYADNGSVNEHIHVCMHTLQHYYRQKQNKNCVHDLCLIVANSLVV